MTIENHSPPPALKANAIGPTRVVAYTAAMIGPAASIVLGLVVAVSFAGYSTPLVVLLSFAAALLASGSIAAFARRLPSAGSFFTYNSIALGRPAGFVTGWLMAFAYLVFVPAGLGATGSFFTDFVAAAFHVHVNENIFLVIVLLLIAFLAYEGINTSASVDIVILVFEMLVILAIAFTIFFKGGPGPIGVSVLEPLNNLKHSFGNLALAMVYTVVIFTGFESGAVLGEESRNPRRTIPRGIFGSVIVVGLFYLIVSWAEMHGVAPKNMASFAASYTQLQTLTSQYWSSGAIWLIDLVVALSTLAFTISAFNSGVRILFAMGREHMLPVGFSKTSHRHTPYVAIIGTSLFALIIGLPVSLAEGGFNTFAYVGGSAGIAFILLYISLNVGVIVAFRRTYKADFKPWSHAIAPVLAIALFCIPLVGTFYPVPAFPYNVLPYIALVWLAIGIVIAAVLAKKRPEALARIGRIFYEDPITNETVEGVGRQLGPIPPIMEG